MLQNTAAHLNPRGAQIEPGIVLNCRDGLMRLWRERNHRLSLRGQSGERTRLACWLRRPAAKNFRPQEEVAFETFAMTGRHRPHAGRVRSPEIREAPSQ
jgi:hypothetical protein